MIHLSLLCGVQFSLKGIIGPYVFRENARRTTTVTEENYVKMFENFFLPKLIINASHKNCYFQQNGTPAHYAGRVRDCLNQLFPNKQIERRGPLE